MSKDANGIATRSELNDKAIKVGGSVNWGSEGPQLATSSLIFSYYSSVLHVSGSYASNQCVRYSDVRVKKNITITEFYGRAEERIKEGESGPVLFYISLDTAPNDILESNYSIDISFDTGSSGTEVISFSFSGGTKTASKSKAVTLKDEVSAGEEIYADIESVSCNLSWLTFSY